MESEPELRAPKIEGVANDGDEPETPVSVPNPRSPPAVEDSGYAAGESAVDDDDDPASSSENRSKGRRPRVMHLGCPATNTVRSGVTSGSPASGAAAGEPATKRKRTEPSSSGTQHEKGDIGSVGIEFTPRVITVNAEQDVLSNINNLTRDGPSSVCILSASGCISKVTLHRSTNEIVDYEGHFEILSMSGIFMISGGENQERLTGKVTVALTGNDGHVFGGAVAGILTAASRVQLIVGIFVTDERKEPK